MSYEVNYEFVFQQSQKSTIKKQLVFNQIIFLHHLKSSLILSTRFFTANYLLNCAF